jgi:hypothetical protein
MLNRKKISRGSKFLICDRKGRKIFLLFLLFLFITPCSLFTKEKKPKQPKQERLSTINKNARTAIKNQSGQDAALAALLGALNRPELSNRQRADIHYVAALLEESLNGVENKKAYLKQPYDTAKFFNKLCNMMNQLRLCDSIDFLPDAKGRVHPRLQKKTHALRLKHRRNIYGGGKYFLTKRNYSAAYPFFDLYCTYKGEENNDTLLASASFWATLSAFLYENYSGTIKHIDNAIANSSYNNATILQEYKVRSFAKLNNDSAWVAALQHGVLDYPQHDYFFVQLADWYQSQRNYEEERKLADRLIAVTGGKAIHYYAKSKSYLSEEKYDECIAYADSTIALQPDFADAYYNKGVAYLNLAVISNEMSSKNTKDPQYAKDRERTLDFYRKARPCMEMVRRLQPEKMERWATPLYRIYLNLNLGDEFTEIDHLLNPK